MTQLSDDIKLTKQKKHTIEVVVDRLVVKDGIRQRLTDSVETALKLANGSIVIDFVDEEEGSPARRQPFSEHRSCPNGHTLELDEVEPRTFSFTPPYGACPRLHRSRLQNWKIDPGSHHLRPRTSHWPTASSNRGAAPR